MDYNTLLVGKGNLLSRIKLQALLDKKGYGEKNKKKKGELIILKIKCR